ncbi:MAG: hypothetical protein IJP90_02095 [Treponema sp.]|nr:hypothetical protein [Treponema sp.]
MNKETTSKIIDFYEKLGFTVREIGQRNIQDSWHNDRYIMVLAERTEDIEKERLRELEAEKRNASNRDDSRNMI